MVAATLCSAVVVLVRFGSLAVAGRASVDVLVYEFSDDSKATYPGYRIPDTL
jgi:hypothetical protein